MTCKIRNLENVEMGELPEPGHESHVIHTAALLTSHSLGANKRIGHELQVLSQEG